MKTRNIGLILEGAILLFALEAAAGAAAAPADTLWMRLGNNKDLSGWSYDPKFFKADSGMCVARGEANSNTFCIRNGTFGDFELRFKARLWEQIGYANSGVQYRSRVGDSAKHQAQGYQMELGAGGCGGFYNEGGLPADLG